MHQFRVHYQDNDVTLGSSSDVFCSIWTGDASPQILKAYEQHLNAFAARRPKKFGLFTVICEKAPLLDRQTRKELASMLERVSPNVCMIGMIFEGAGFRGPAVRSVVTGITMMTRSRLSFPIKVHSTVEAAVPDLLKALSAETGKAYPEDGLVTALKELRASHPGG